MKRRTKRRVAAGLLVVGALLLLLGVSNESSGENAPRESSESTTGHTETATEPSTEAVPAGDAHTASEVLGIDTESTPAVAAALALSALLAALLTLHEARAIARTVAVFAFAFAMFDIAEVAHQIDVSKPGLAVLAIVVAIGHLGSGGLAAAVVRPDDISSTIKP